MRAAISWIIKRLFGSPAKTSLPIMTVEEFASLLKVQRVDIDRAIKNGQLVPGRHFMLIDKKIRFLVTNELIASIMTDCQTAYLRASKISSKEQVQRAVRRQRNNMAATAEGNAA